MSHEELRALLAGYAAGGLDATAAAAVQAHLASGCAVCLDDVYRRPVGLVPEPPPVAPPSAPMPLPGATTARRGCAPAIAGAVVAVAVAAGAGWMVLEAGERAAGERRTLESRLAEVEGQRAELGRRVTSLEDDVAAAQGEAARQAGAVRATAEESAQLRGDLETAEARIAALARRNSAIERHLGGGENRQALEALAATPGVELLRLDPVPPFAGARGHVLLHPARDTVVLYVFDLPPTRAGSSYRVRLRGENGHVDEPELQPRPRGDAAVPLRLRGAAGGLREVQVVLEPSGQAVLAGRRRAN